jgi:hypothetical protein
MFVKYQKIIFSSLMIVLSFLIMAQVVLAAVEDTTGLNTTAKQGFGSSVITNNSDLPTMIGRIIGTGLAFLGVVFFVLILYAGLGWILSMGNEEKIKQSKDMIIAAILGLIVVLGAYAITMLIPIIFEGSAINPTVTPAAK